MSTVRNRLVGKQPAPRATIQEVFEALNRPGVERLKTALRARNIPFTNEEVRDVVKGSEAKQLMAPRQRYDGRIASSDINERWAADLIDFTARPSGQYTHILIVQDIFSRRIFARPLTGTTSREVSEAFQSILNAEGTPQQLNTDGGAEFNSGSFPMLLDSTGIMHVVKNPQDKNAIATLDRAIQAIKPLLNVGVWAKTLQKVVSGHNAAPSSHLMDSAPDDVPDSKKLQFAMKWQGIEDREHNESNIAKRGQRLEREGTFRVEERVDKMTRGFKPRFGDKVHAVERVEGATVVDEEGNRFSTKFVQPVQPGSRSTGAGRSAYARVGSAAVDERRRRPLQPFVNSTTAFIRSKGGTASLSDLGTHLRKRQGFMIAVRESGISQKAVIANFLRLFPRKFEVTIAPGVSTVTLK